MKNLQNGSIVKYKGGDTNLNTYLTVGNTYTVSDYFNKLGYISFDLDDNLHREGITSTKLSIDVDEIHCFEVVKR